MNPKTLYKTFTRYFTGSKSTFLFDDFTLSILEIQEEFLSKVDEIQVIVNFIHYDDPSEGFDIRLDLHSPSFVYTIKHLQFIFSDLIAVYDVDENVNTVSLYPLIFKTLVEQLKNLYSINVVGHSITKIQSKLVDECSL